MKKSITIFLITAVSLMGAVSAQEKATQTDLATRKGEAAAAGAWTASAISMVVWGTLMIAGITAAAIFLSQDNPNSSTSN